MEERGAVIKTEIEIHVLNTFIHQCSHQYACLAYTAHEFTSENPWQHRLYNVNRGERSVAGPASASAATTAGGGTSSSDCIRKLGMRGSIISTEKGGCCQSASDSFAQVLQVFREAFRR